jgi:ABC-type methionine transport system ATPase subunit
MDKGRAPDGPGPSHDYNPGVARGRFHLTLPERLADEPVIHTLGSRFDLVTNIRRASIEDRTGWVILELEGSEEAIADAVRWMAEQDVEVERIDDSE